MAGRPVNIVRPKIYNFNLIAVGSVITLWVLQAFFYREEIILPVSLSTLAYCRDSLNTHASRSHSVRSRSSETTYIDKCSTTGALG